jgi:hypothetical protein
MLIAHPELNPNLKEDVVKFIDEWGTSEEWDGKASRGTSILVVF